MLNSRLRTSKITDEKLEELHRIMNLSSKAAIARISIGISLKISTDPRNEKIEQLNDNTGFEFQRNTLAGDFDDVYRAMMTQHIGHHILDEEYFPKLIKAHIERGIFLLYSEYQLLGNREKLIDFLLGVS